jgi:para-aminobenzoate synthetase component 1
MRKAIQTNLNFNWKQFLRNAYQKGYAKICFLNSNEEDGVCYLALGAISELKIDGHESSFEALKNYMNQTNDWVFGHFSYDLKNETERLVSENGDGVGFTEINFFQPEYVLKFESDQVVIYYNSATSSEEQAQSLLEELQQPVESEFRESINVLQIKPRISREAYLQQLGKLKQHIQLGDIYEVNFCQEFFAENATIQPLEVYLQLNDLTKAPFSAFYRMNEHYLLSASPERFIRKMGERIISQPIKGTIKRGASAVEDEALKQQLLNDPKERSENVMIVDLVRNDLSKTAQKGSVEVEELFGIHTFETVHQMISTVSSQLKPDVHPVDAIRHAFPMGSMTGAPKMRAMELIESYETTKRGVYSGALGYFTPEGDFDFNVVIRSILYHAERKYLSMMVGGAITAKSDPEKEYEECLLKAEALLQTFNVNAENVTAV